jgi:hypothetical protein
MAQLITVRTDYNALSRKLQASVKRYPRAAAAGINRAADRAYTFSVRALQADIGTSSQKTIRKNLSVWHATADKPEAKLIAFSSKQDRIPIFEMRPRPRAVTKRRPQGGVRYGPNQTLIPGSFVARMPSGHVGVFKRISQARNPIVELKGPSVALVFAHRKIQAKLSAFLQETVPREIERAFRFMTG